MSNFIKYHIIVTGASSGLGLELVLQLTKLGHQVIGLSQTIEDKINSLGLDLKNNFLGVNCNLAEPIDSLKILNSIESFFNGKLDVVINCAGQGTLGPLELIHSKTLIKQFYTNCFGNYELIKFCIPYLKKSKGKIINITSMTSFTTFPFYGAYSASKSAFSKISEALYYELNPLGINVTDIQLGAFKSQFVKNSKIYTFLSNSSHCRNTYNHRINKFVKFQNKLNDFQTINVSKISKRILKLVTKKKINPIYIWGIDAKINYILRKIIPINAFIKIQSWIYIKWIY